MWWFRGRAVVMAIVKAIVMAIVMGSIEVIVGYFVIVL